MNLPSSVRLVEVGPRDGLQNEAARVPTEVKLRFIEALADAGLKDIEVTSFVNPKRIPQLADALEVVAGLPPRPGVRWSALVPNMKGLERAKEAGISRIAVFTAASETFTQQNIGMSVQQSLETFAEVARDALGAGMSVRGYVSTCFGCPYEGKVRAERVLEVTEALLEMGVDEVSLGDTIGIAVPTDVLRVLRCVLGRVAADKLALHYHDTSGTALANVLVSMEMGIQTFDASAGGLGGCPYAPGAAGNLATEDLVYFLQKMGVECGVDLQKLADASMIVERALGRLLPGKQFQRLKSTRRGASTHEE